MRVVRLILQDGSQWLGRCRNVAVHIIGEVVVDSRMTGYEKALVDPAFAEKIVVMTYPLIGNYGLPTQFCQSAVPSAAALICRQLCTTPRLMGNTVPLTAYLERYNVPAAQDLDTRALARYLARMPGCYGLLTSDLKTPPAVLAAELKDRLASRMDGKHLTKDFSEKVKVS